MKSKSVLLINPRTCSGRGVRMPLSLLALGAALEGKHEYQLIDANIDPDPIGAALKALSRGNVGLIGVSVMPGPQVAPAIEISSALRAAHPQVPILWGGYFPTLYPEAAINAPYVDFLARGQGEETLLELLDVLPDTGSAVKDINGLTWKDSGSVSHNPDRSFRSPDDFPPYPYRRLGNLVDTPPPHICVQAFLASEPRCIRRLLDAASDASFVESGIHV